VILARDGRLDLVRPAPQRALRLGFATWMALARHDRVRVDDEPEPLL
jgi:hypothetical protein